MTASISAVSAGYALDSPWHAERGPPQTLTALYDPASVSICARLGLRPGWRCADVGAGTGSLAQELAARVAPRGSGLAVDVARRLLEPPGVPGLEVLSADITTQPLPQGEFDLVHARLLLSECGLAVLHPTDHGGGFDRPREEAGAWEARPPTAPVGRWAASRSSR